MELKDRTVLVTGTSRGIGAEIARELWITEDTVRTHIKRMMIRLEARTRAHAVAIAFREGLWVESARADGGDDVR